MTKAKILVVEDDPNVLVFVIDQLEYLGYQVTAARDGVEGIERVAQEKPDLIVLDVMMPEMDGYEVCHHLKSAPETRDIPVLMLTAKGQLQDKLRGFDRGADDYLSKPYDKAEFEARVRVLLRRPASSPYTTPQDDCTLSILCSPGRRINVRISGRVALNAVTEGTLGISVDAYARHGDNVPRLDWRFNSKELGKQLHRALFVSHPEVLSNYSHALGEVEDEEKLHLRLQSPRDLLRVPFEFLFEGIQTDGDYLVLRHPLSRSVIGVRVRRMPLSPTVLNDLWVNGEPLRVLLIASNTKPPIPGVDREIEALAGSLPRLFEDVGISIRVRAIPTQESTCETVGKELRRCRYHVVHYAGHGSYDRHSPEKSYLSFWERPNCRGGVKRMTVAELRMLLRGADSRFVYLSCCLGAKTGEPDKLLDDDFLGMADGFVQAGVPSVLGFRWPVSDAGAAMLALAFYRSLAEQGQIDSALLDARCQVAARDRDDITWLSPVLIMQA